MYLSRIKILLSNFLSVAMLIASGFFIFVGGIGTLLVILEFFGFTNELDSHKLIEYLAVYLAFLGFFIPMAVIAVKRITLTNKAKKFNSFFESDPDGVISLENMSKLCGKTVPETAELFNKLVENGYLINCSLQNPDKPVIALNNGADTAAERFDTVCCPNCGAHNQIKVDFAEHCQYCGAGLRSEKNSSE